MQTVFGPRFFIPCKFQSDNKHKFYRTKDEILETNKDYEYVNNL
jgi:hypothetical protein